MNKLDSLKRILKCLFYYEKNIYRMILILLFIACSVFVGLLTVQGYKIYEKVCEENQNQEIQKSDQQKTDDEKSLRSEKEKSGKKKETLGNLIVGFIVALILTLIIIVMGSDIFSEIWREI